MVRADPSGRADRIARSTKMGMAANRDSTGFGRSGREVPNDNDRRSGVVSGLGIATGSFSEFRRELPDRGAGKEARGRDDPFQLL